MFSIITKALQPTEISLQILPGPTDQALRLFDGWCKKRNTKMILFCTIHQIEKQMPITLSDNRHLWVLIPFCEAKIQKSTDITKLFIRNSYGYLLRLLRQMLR